MNEHAVSELYVAHQLEGGLCNDIPVVLIPTNGRELVGPFERPVHTLMTLNMHDGCTIDTGKVILTCRHSGQSYQWYSRARGANNA